MKLTLVSHQRVSSFSQKDKRQSQLSVKRCGTSLWPQRQLLILLFSLAEVI